jgi:3-hydroxyisobutyrate dehydrogenase-like beta-hydroxyacid dehydrogenase
MRVTANSDLTFFYEMVPYTVTAGQVVDGAGARHLLATGADVTVLDEEPAAEPVAESKRAEVVDGLDISAKIDDVLAWVGDDPERALEAHAAEEAKGDKARTRLLAQLEEIATGDSND